jgi:hypothetical protein
MSWEVDPEPADAHDRAVLLAAAEQAFAAEPESAWWRSGLGDLGVSPPAEEARGDPGVVQP